MGIQPMIGAKRASSHKTKCFVTSWQEREDPWTCLLRGEGVDLAGGMLRAQKCHFSSSMIISCSSVVLVVSMGDGDTLAGELWLGKGVGDPGRVDKAGDGVEPGMQVTRFDFPSA